MLRSSIPASDRPVTAAHASAVSSAKTDVSSMNRATSGGCWSSTSEMKYSAIGWLWISTARATRAGSRAPRSDSAAICSAATHPSVH
jgi:hypothetical protein